MKLRAALLLVCMITVPLVAMFSHKVSASTRQALRRRIWDPLVDSAAASLGLGDAPSSGVDPVLEGGDPHPSIGPIRAAGDAAASAPADPDGFAGGDRTPPVTPMFADRARPPADDGTRGPVATSSGAAPTAFTGPMPGASDDLASLEARLRALGATGIEWTPSQGGDGMHRCRCRIPADPSGQLQRVFQASAPDPIAALDSLVGQVTAWSMRTRADSGQGRDIR